ncbi:hypothetical protein [Haliea sp.]|uniref:hypothetical protein n=1 Tax=Haliea sp. TaxID=1932666 RepID=UPI00257DB5A3|nr:hypothetical protein [Haliea sp.]|tara:strand:+ start:203 stop:1087 length:885 start_codon:yes stop_codon:yes gene_type:complete
MSAFKQFLAQDILISPFEVNKGFSFTSSSFLDSTVGIAILNGVSGSFLTNKTITNIDNFQEFKSLVFDSIKHLYYSNYSVSSSSDPINLPTDIRGSQPEGDTIQGSRPYPNFDNYLQSTLHFNKFVLTGSDDLSVVSIPSKLYGDQIQPHSFNLTDGTTIFTDDGEGNILSGSNIIGNIFYPHGIAVVTSGSENIDFVTGSVTCSFSSSRTIYETQYKCTLRENEFNFTQNPTIVEGSLSGSLRGFATASYFEPYITTIGLYDEAQNLLAVGKLAIPYPSPRSTDTTFIINLDR